jgi:hypothetical protein
MRTMVLIGYVLTVGTLQSQTFPPSMTECEAGLCASGGNGPGTWTFHSRKGEAVWPVPGKSFFSSPARPIT